MQRAIARVRELLDAGRTADARAELQRAARDAGLDLHLALSLAPASMIPLLSNVGQLDRGKCALFAELLYLERERALADGDPDHARRAADRALWFYDQAYHGSPPDDDTRTRFDALRTDA